MEFSRQRVATACLLMMMALILGGEVQVSTAVTCTITELSPCLGAITASQPPSALCCAKLKEQNPCLCQYAKDPTYGHYFYSPRSKEVAKICGIPFPNC